MEYDSIGDVGLGEVLIDNDFAEFFEISVFKVYSFFSCEDE